MIRVGKQSEPIVQKTHLGWTIISPGKVCDVTSMMLTKNSICDHDQLCRLNVLDIEGSPTGDRIYVYQYFQDQLERKADGSQETALLWKPGHPPLNSNKNGTLSRLNNLIIKLPKDFEQYDQIILLLKKLKESNSKFPINQCKRRSREYQMRIVYEASSKSVISSPSLNACLETRLSFQNLLWNVVIQNRFSPVVLCGDIK